MPDATSLHQSAGFRNVSPGWSGYSASEAKLTNSRDSLKFIIYVSESAVALSM